MGSDIRLLYYKTGYGGRPARPALSEEELVSAFRLGDNSSFEGIYEIIRQPVYELFYRHLHDRQLAEDLCQDTMEKVIESIRSGRYHEQGKLVNYVRHTAKNVYLDWVKHQKKILQTEAEITTDPADNAPSAEDVLETKQRLQLIYDNIPKLGKVQGEVFRLMVFEKLEVTEVAARLGKSVNDITSIFDKAKKSMSDIIKSLLR